MQRGARVTYSDSFVPQIRIDGLEMSSQDVAADADCVVIVTDHSGVDYAHLVERSVADRRYPERTSKLPIRQNRPFVKLWLRLRAAVLSTIRSVFWLFPHTTAVATPTVMTAPQPLPFTSLTSWLFSIYAFNVFSAGLDRVVFLHPLRPMLIIGVIGSLLCACSKDV